MKRQLTSAGLSLSILSAAFLTLGGCGGDGLDTRYKVTGTVTYKGAPLAKGLISFISTNPDGRGATGQVADGAYSLTTQEPNDGAFPGSYSVTVSAKNLDLEKAAAEAKKKGNTSDYIPQDFLAKAAREAPSLIPVKYSTLSPTNPLKADVKASSNTINFDLTD